MNMKIHWLSWVSRLFKEFISESTSKSAYEIVDIFECEKTGDIKVIIKLSARHVIEKSINEIVTDDMLMEGFNKKTIRTLTYIATMQSTKPDYSILIQEMDGDNYRLKIKSKNNIVFNRTPTEIVKDKETLKKFDAFDASRIGYLAGIKETIQEIHMNPIKN